MKWKEQDLTYPGDRVSESGECEPAVTTRTRCGWLRNVVSYHMERAFFQRWDGLSTKAI